MDLLAPLSELLHLGWVPVLMAAAGVGMGLLIGAMPGLNQGVLMALTLPLTMTMSDLNAQCLLIGMYVGGASGAMVMGVLIGVPGSPSAIMTTFDGHAMARKGQAARALALGVSAAFLGGLVSWLVLATLAIPLSSIALLFTPVEFTSLIFGGLLIIAVAGDHDPLKGLMAGFLGMLAAIVGLDPVTSNARFIFGFLPLQSGFGLLPVLLGTFAIGQLLANITADNPVADQARVRFVDTLRSVRAVGRHWLIVLRSGLIGCWMGMHPGVGASIGSIIAYMVTRNLADDPKSFGTGREEGVVASEAGSVGTIGGALLPMISLGIPGSPADVILMAALVFHNIQPGPMLIVEHPTVFYGIIVTLFVSLVLMFVLLLPLCTVLGRVAALP
ncbi:MAG TPA: tripartite tricarboxylate transporter permease, partial [Stellaceae bacterium]|nr:tripartite tricarboxylate transporter permease [Stellaceae bacterium]